MERPIRIGVLGAARIADLAIVKPAHAAGHRLVAVAARDRRRAEDFARHYGVERVLGSYADVLADADVEVIYNPLANALHGPWNLAAVGAGKHVLSEKPFTSNADEARVVRDAAAAASVSVMEGFHYRYHPVTRRLHELLNFVEPHHGARIIVTTAAGTRTEELGRRSSYTYQLEAFAAHLRDGAPLPADADDAVANMQLIDDCYRAAGLTPRPAGQPLINIP
jgi:predicted dehydrogenase